MALATGYEEFANLSIAGPSIWEQLKINKNPLTYSKTITVPPGRHVIRFNSDAKRVDSPTDSRLLVFKVINSRLEEVK